MLDFIAQIPVLKQLNVWAGGILGFLEVYLIIFIVLFIGALLPIEGIQAAIDPIYSSRINRSTYTRIFLQLVHDCGL